MNTEGQTAEEVEAIRRKKIEEMVKRVFASVHDDVIYNKEAKAHNQYVDPTPNFIEGIFYIDKTSCIERYC